MRGTRPTWARKSAFTLWHDDVTRGEEALAAIFAEMARIDELMSTYIEDSEISAINRDAARMPVETSAEHVWTGSTFA